MKAEGLEDWRDERGYILFDELAHHLEEVLGTTLCARTVRRAHKELGIR